MEVLNPFSSYVLHHSIATPLSVESVPMVGRFVAVPASARDAMVMMARWLLRSCVCAGDCDRARLDAEFRGAMERLHKKACGHVSY